MEVADESLDEAPYGEQWSDDSDEAISRAVIRIIPAARGLFVGAAIDTMMLGLAAGMGLSATLDLCMEKKSIVRCLTTRLIRYACPSLTVTAHRLADTVNLCRLPQPGFLRSMRCERPETGADI